MNPPRLALLSALVAVALLLVACGDEEQGAAPLAPPRPLLPVPGVPWAGVSQSQLDGAHAMGVPAAFENAWGMRFVYIPPGTFQMGSPEDEPGRGTDETLHTVHIGRGFYMQVRPASWKQLLAAGVLPPDEAKFVAEVQSTEDPDFDLTAYRAVPDRWLSLAAELSETSPGRSYRLPTEAEWEYAMRAGTQTAFWWGTRDCISEAERERYEVNPWGLEELRLFGVELCSDVYGALPSWEVSDPQGPGGTGGRVLRCGGRLAARHTGIVGIASGPYNGDRVALRLVSPVGYGLGTYGSSQVTFRLVDRDGEDAPNRDYDLRVISMNDRLAARTRGVDAVWQRVAKPALPATLSMVPGAYYVYAEGRRDGALVRGTEQKFHAKPGALVQTVPVPEQDLARFGSGAREEPK